MQTNVTKKMFIQTSRVEKIIRWKIDNMWLRWCTCVHGCVCVTKYKVSIRNLSDKQVSNYPRTGSPMLSTNFKYSTPVFFANLNYFENIPTIISYYDVRNYQFILVLSVSTTRNGYSKLFIFLDTCNRTWNLSAMTYSIIVRWFML